MGGPPIELVLRVREFKMDSVRIARNAVHSPVRVLRFQVSAAMPRGATSPQEDGLVKRLAPTRPIANGFTNVKAFIVGIEEYHGKASGGLSKVDYARRDAQALQDTLREIYGTSLESELLVDNEATASNVQYELKGFIESLEEDDLFVFYYAGHGFYGAGGNRITTWDTHAHSVEQTTLLLRDVLLEPLQQSKCKRALAFVDACAANFAPLIKSRSVISNFSDQELKQYLTATDYFGLYLSCSPAEKSYPSDRLQHGIWTYFLLKALRGEATEALDRGRFLTDQGLKDYLRTSVTEYLTKETKRKSTQTPRALINSSGTFAIRQVPEPMAVVSEAGDLSEVRFAPTEEYFEGLQEGSIRSLPGYSSRRHFVPDSHSEGVDSFIRERLATDVLSETQELYDSIQQDLGLRARDIAHDTDGGFGGIDTQYFRYTVEPRQHPRDASKYQIVRKLELREPPEPDLLGQISQLFSNPFDRLVVKTSRDFTDFSTLVDKLEDLASRQHGAVRVESPKKRVTYTAEDGSTIVFSVGSGKISVSARSANSVGALLDVAQRFRFGLDAPSVLLIG